MTDILILGDSSFLTNYLVRHLVSRGYEIDLLTDEKDSISEKGFIDHFVCDRNNENEMKRLLGDKNYSYIFDISGASKKDLEILFNVIDGSNLNRYIYCSSLAIYKQGSAEVDQSKSITDDKILETNGVNVVEVEKFIFELIKSKDLSATIFRPSYIYENSDSLDRDAYFAEAIMKGEEILVPNNTKAQFIHVDDVAKNLECAMFNDNDKRAYFLAHPTKYSWDDVVKLIGNTLNKPAITSVVSTDTLAKKPLFPFKTDSMDLDISNLRNNGFHSPMVLLHEKL